MKFLEKIWFYLVMFLALFPLLPRVVESILMISISAISLILFFLKKTEYLKQNIIKVLLFSSVFLIYIMSLFYTINLNQGFRYLKLALPIFVFPFVFGVLRTNQITQKRVSILENIYVFALILGLIICQIFFAFNKEGLQTSWDYRNAIEKLTDVHGTYISLWIGLGLILSFKKLTLFLNDKAYLFSVVFSSVIAYLLYWQITIEARMPLIATIIALIVFFFSYLKSKKTIIILFFSLVIFIVGFTFINPSYYNRLIVLKNHKFELPKGDYNVDFDKISNEHIRNGIYYCGSVLAKESWLTGFGIGDVDDKLQECYDTKIDSNVYNIFNFNSHNQYLHILLASGIIGLVFFIASLLFTIYLALKNKDGVYLSFAILIFMCLLTENILSRHDGILFYSFFNAIFAFKIAYKNEKSTNT